MAQLWVPGRHDDRASGPYSHRTGLHQYPVARWRGDRQAHVQLHASFVSHIASPIHTSSRSPRLATLRRSAAPTACQSATRNRNANPSRLTLELLRLSYRTPHGRRSSPHQPFKERIKGERARATSPPHIAAVFGPMRVQSRCSALLVASAVVAAPGTATTTVSVDVPIQVPSNSAPLASTLLSFSIEQDRWPDWSGIDERNEFTYSALETYANLTGQPPKIRVGGDSEDNTAWSPTVTV